MAKLETVLPPRVVSRALQEGLSQVERDPATVALPDIEQILKVIVFRHLQVTLPAEQARATVEALLVGLRSVAATDPRSGGTEPEGEPSDEVAAWRAPSEADTERLQELHAQLRPFNLYFDWSEVRKLRAQAQAIEQELAAGIDVAASFEEAEAQLRLVVQKLEDQLVLQARDLGELEEALESVQTLGGPRVRRLEALIGQVRQAQATRTLADAEVERGRKLARDLRKLMESSVFHADAPPDTRVEGRRRRSDIVPSARGAAASEAAEPATDDDAGGDDETVPIAAEHLSPEVTERLLRLDLEAETKELHDLRDEYAELLRYLPALRDPFDALQARLEAQSSVAADIAALHATLVETAIAQRKHLDHELATIATDMTSLEGGVDASGLERALRVTRDILIEGLPSYADVSAIRDLHRSARERSEELVRRAEGARERNDAQVRVQIEVVERLDAALSRREFDAEGFEGLREALARARDALAASVAAGVADADALERARREETLWERAVAEHAGDVRERLRARLRADDARLSAMPELGSIWARASDLRSEVANLLDRDDLDETQVASVGSLVDRLHADAVAEASHRLETLGKEAGESVGDVVLRALQAAARSLAAGEFPDLGNLRLIIDQERAVSRDRDHVRLQRLQLEATRLDASGVPSVEHLRSALATARRELDEGRPGTRFLDAADTALLDIERQVRERLGAFEHRLDAALVAFAAVERLNNDDVASVRRILTHLDSQRDAVTRVSPGLQFQLISALGESEALLHDLQEAYEATREVADRLVSSTLLDDVLGFFDAFDPGDAPAGAELEAPATDVQRAAPEGGATPTTVAVAGIEAPAALPSVDAGRSRLVAVCGALPGVRTVLLVDGGGRLLAGHSGDLDAEAFARAVRSADGSWAEIAAAFGGGGADLVDIGLEDRHVIVAAVGGDGALVVAVTDAAQASAVGDRLRLERDALAAADPAR